MNEATREIVRLYRGGLTVRAIGRLLGLRHMTVTIALERAGVPRDAPQSRGGKSAKLTAARVRAIRRRHAAGESPAALAREYDVHVRTIRRIVHRVTWRHVDE
jgi:DNA invertase Pin-like site-specific DNA recombinase